MLAQGRGTWAVSQKAKWILLFFKKHFWHSHPVRVIALTGPCGSIYSSSSGSLSTAGRCKKITCTVYRTVYGLSLTLTSFLAVSDYFYGYFLIRKNTLLWRVILFLSFSRVKKVKSLMFLKFSFHAHQTQLDGGFILSAYRLVYKCPKPTLKWLEQSAVWL